MNKKLVIGLMIILGLLLIPAAWAARDDLPKYILDQMHNDINYSVITERNLDDLPKILDTVKPKFFLVVQCKPEALDADTAAKIMEWVKRGGILWFYDSRLAPSFGMENSPLEKDDMNGQPHNGDYGTGKVSGFNVVAHASALEEHQIVTGVQSIQVFIMEVGKNQFSAVKSDTPGVIPLFQVNLQKKTVVALKGVGKGWIIFKPLIWLDVLGGERFQVNLKEFSGGYGVPKSRTPIISPDAFKIDKKGPPKLSRLDSMILSDGQQVLGKIEENTFEIAADSGTLKKKVSEIESIKFLPTGTRIKLSNGSEIVGTILTMGINFRTTAGKVVNVAKEDIVSINFNVGKDAHK